MVVDSTLELYTLLFGWLFYNSIWEVLVATGMVFLPFLGIVLDAVLRSYAGEDAEEAGNTSLRIIEVEFFVAFMVILFAGVPAIPLSASDLSFTPKAMIGTPAQPVETPANSQTTYGGSISFIGYPNRVDVPVFWYTVLSFATGFNRAVMEDVPTTIDLRTYANQLREVRISDPALQQEVNDFFRDCFVEARSRYLAEQSSSAQITSLLNNYGVTDPEWMGSHLYQEVPGFYDSIRAESVKTGFPWSPLRDIEWEVGDHPLYGKPYCSEWWPRLASKILNETDGMDLIAAAAEPGWDAVKRQDAVIQAVLLNSPPRWTTRGYDFAYGNQVKFHTGDTTWGMDWVQNKAQQGLAAYGLAKESLSFAAYLRIVLEAAPMFQALVLMGLYALLPFFIVISRYKLSVLMMGALILFVVKFWTVLWFFAWWVDQNLIRAFYPDPGSVTTLFSIDMTIKRVILNLLTGMLYIVFPFLFSLYLSMAGIHAGRGLDSATTTMTQRIANTSQVKGKLPRFKRKR